MFILGGEGEFVQGTAVLASPYHERERRTENRWEGVRRGMAP